MTRSIKILSLLLLFILCSCQARIGTIEVLDGIKVSDVSGIYVIKPNTLQGYLTENDETSVIKEIKKIKSSNLLPFDGDNPNYDYCIVVETINNKYEIQLLELNNININHKQYSVEQTVTKNICDVINSATYLK